MIRPAIQITPELLQSFSQQGSPVLLNSVGRIFGLGNGEQNALRTNGIPTWATVLIATSIGLLAGAYIQRRWPRVTDAVIGKKGK